MTYHQEQRSHSEPLVKGALLPHVNSYAVAVDTESNTIVVNSRAPNGQVRLTLEINTDPTCEAQRDLLYNELSRIVAKEANPLLVFQEQYWDREYIDQVKIRIPELGSIPFKFDSKIPVLPSALSYVPLPSEIKDDTSSLKLAAGFMTALDRQNLDLNKTLTVFECDIGNLGATNEVLGPAFADTLFKKMKDIAEEAGIELFRQGGDEFSGLILGDSTASNHAKLKIFRDRYIQERDELLSTISEDDREKLHLACVMKQQLKKRKHLTEPLDMYLASTSLKVSTLIDWREKNINAKGASLDRAVALTQILGKTDHRLYEMKDSNKRVVHQEVDELTKPRRADIEAVRVIRNADKKAAELKSLIKVPQSIFERIALYLELVQVSATDPSLGHSILRANLLDAPVSHRGAIRDVIKQFMPDATVYKLDVGSFGKINDAVGAQRADLFLRNALQVALHDTPCILTRVGGGAFLLTLPEGTLDKNQQTSLLKAIQTSIDDDIVSALRGFERRKEVTSTVTLEDFSH
jgi:GGDEF domain-containing protein